VPRRKPAKLAPINEPRARAPLPGARFSDRARTIPRRPHRV